MVRLENGQVGVGARGLRPRPPAGGHLKAVASLVAALALSGCAAPELDDVPPGFELHPAFTLELAAAEPITVDPIDLAFDERGRVFVLELPGYPDMERPARIVQLSDRDGDGRWDERRLFADDLGMADSILPWRDGLLVAAPPDILHLRDTNGDGKADRRDALLSGFAEGNPQHNVNALRYGLDNWVYGVNGGNGARVFWPHSPGEATDIGRDDFRVDFGARRFERTGRGADGFGMTLGPWGRAFGTHNLNHLSQVVVPRRYLDRLPAAWRDGRQRLAAPADGGPAELFPIGVRRTRPNHPEQSNRFSAACAVTAYAGGAFGLAGLEEEGLHVFVADPSANVVHRAVVDTDGAVAEAGRGRPGVEFLASTDPLFRPVNLTVGPDGALYVLDMHRDVIEHPEWIPDRMEAELDLYEGEDRGRIYRIVAGAGAATGRGNAGQPGVRAAESSQTGSERAVRPVGGPAGSTEPASGFTGLDRANPAELLEALSHPNRWRRITAQRLLVEELAADPPETVVHGLRELLRDSRRPFGRLHALWTLSGLAALDAESLGAALRDSDPEVRRNAVLAFEEGLQGGGRDGREEPGRPDSGPPGNREAPTSTGSGTALAEVVVGLIGDPDPAVRLQAMLTTGLFLGSEAGSGAALRDAAMAAVVAGLMAEGRRGFSGGEPRPGQREASQRDDPRAPGSGVGGPDASTIGRTTAPAGLATPEAGAAARSPDEARWRRLATVSVLADDPIDSLDLLLASGVDDGEVVERIAALLPAERLGDVMADGLVLKTLSASAADPSGISSALLAGLTAAASSDRTVDESALAEPLRRLRQASDDALAAAAWRLSAALNVEASVAEVVRLDCAGMRAANPAGPLEERVEAVALFGLRRHWTAVPEVAEARCPDVGGAHATAAVSGTWLERMGALLGAEQPGPLQRAAMAELASADESAVTGYLIARWPTLGPAARRDAASYLIRGRNRHAALLDAIEGGRIRLGEMNFDLERRRFLLRSPEPEIRQRARALFDDAGVVTRGEAIEAMRPALALDGDAARGESLFLELCARCHRSGGFGSGPGPDLSGIGRKSAETLLHDILDPNAAVDAAWVNTIVETTDGEVHTGLLAESVGGGVVLRAAEDRLIEVPAERVRQIRSDGLSMMPEELEAGLEPADMADLLAFLNR